MAFYAVILDAGSGSTRAHMYRVTPSGGGEGQVGVILRRDVNNNPQSIEKKDGIQTVQRSEDVRPYLESIVEAVNEVLNGLPAPALERKLYLLATGGVRDADQQHQRNLSRWVKSYIEGLDSFTTVVYAVISGTDEAKYGWIAANYSQENPLATALGYVEMGGASAQIAVPISDAAVELGRARAVVTQLNGRNREDMVQEGWRNEDLDAVVGLLEDEGAPEKRNAAEGGLERILNLSNEAKLEKVRNGMWLLSASYRLGANTGVKAYQTVMFGAELTEQQKGEILDQANSNVFYDPSQRRGYVTLVGDRIITGRQQEDTGRKKLAMTRDLATRALRTLVSPDALEVAKGDLKKIVGNVKFIGAANFWWSMKPQISEEDLSLQGFWRMLWASHDASDEDFRRRLGNDPVQIDLLKNSVLKAVWSELTLEAAFGLSLPIAAANRITFTPYNGIGPVNGRFSWTLGKAALLASRELNLAALTSVN